MGLFGSKSKKIDAAKKLEGTVQFPGDKSISHRYAMLAAIANGESEIHFFSTSADCQSTLNCLKSLGVKIERKDIPVMASQVGGLGEAMLGMDYLLPVRPVVHYRSAVDELMVPAAEIPEQDIGPWRAVLERLLTHRAHYEQLSAASRQAALAYAAGLTGQPFEAYLERIVQTAKRRETAGGESPKPAFSPERQRLMALRLRRKLAGGAADVAE